MPDTILPGFTFDRTAARYRDVSRGQFVSRARIMDLMDGQVTSAERRLGDLTTALHEGRISPTMYQTTMRDELRRLHLQNSALAKGGFDRLTFRDYGRTGGLLRQDYQRLTNLANDLQAGRVSLPQALNRIQGYIGSARINFLEAERDTARATGRRMEERRRLGVSEHCKDCVSYAALGWQPLGTLPLPGQGSACGAFCRCNLERREEEERVAA